MQALLDSSHALLGEEGRGFFINGNAEILSSNVCEDMSAMLKANYPKSLRCRVYNMGFLSDRATEFNICIDLNCVRNYHWPSATKTRCLMLQYLILILHTLLAVSLAARPDLATMTDVLSENQAYFK